MMATHIIVSLLSGMIAGFVQHFVIGLVARSWDFGTSILWGLICAIPAAIAAIWLGWLGCAIAGASAVAAFAGSLVSILLR